MKKLLTILFIVNCITASIAQKAIIQPLEVGDKVPDVLISAMINNKTSLSKLSSFKGKLLILDFWGVYCTSCITEMPYMQQLQEEFGDRIQILLVTSDSKKMVEDLYKRSKVVRELHLPFVVADTVLTKMFPYNALGLHVWIDGNGNVIQKTDAGTYSAKEIKRFLAGEQVSLVQRNDDIDFDRNTPLWLEGNGRQLKYMKYHSFISSKLVNVHSGGSSIVYDSVTKLPSRIYCINMPIGFLYSQAFAEGGKFKWDKIIWEVKDSARYFEPKERKAAYEWRTNNTYCYELQVNSDKARKFYALMQQDLQRFFDVRATLEKRKTKFWILKRNGTSDSLFKTKQNEERYSGHGTNKDSIVLHKANFRDLRNALIAKGLDVIDETDYKGFVTISIPWQEDGGNYKIVRESLQQYGLDLKDEDREVTCLVLKEDGYITQKE